MKTTITPHTPGPWVIRGSDLNPQRLNIVQEGQGTVPLIGIADGNPSGEANARLCAAAPELLDALEDVYEWCDLIEQNYPEMRFTAKVRAAIAKAGGAS